MQRSSRSYSLRRAHRVVLGGAVALLAGCVAGPDYVRPTMDVPSAYKESGPWKEAVPGRADSDRAWWLAFRDETLDALVRQAQAANQDIVQAEARYREARAIADAARAGFWPTLGLHAGVARAQTNNAGVKLGTDYTLGVGASWEPDLWGSVRRSVEAGDAGAQASADDLAAARLSIQAAVAQNYLQLRVIDLQLDLYVATTAAYAKSLQLTRYQYAAGVTLRSDVALAETQLKSA